MEDENKMKQYENFVENLKLLKEGFRLGETWRRTDKHLGCVIPILRDRVFDRSYQIFEELKEEDYKITDTGAISEIRFYNMSRENIFIRVGTIFKGIGTQNRSPEMSVIVPKMKEIVIMCRCVHQSHSINAGSMFVKGGTVPGVVLRSLSDGDQSAVWSSVSSYSRNRAFTSSLMTDRISVGVDDLHTTMETMKEDDDIKDLLKEVPCLENQIGVIICDKEGIQAVEMFDHPDSWKSFHENVITSYSDIINTQVEKDLFEINFKEDMIPELFNNFMSDMQRSQQKEVFRKGDAVTFKLDSVEIHGEYTALNDKIIHVLGFRKENKKEDKSNDEKTRQNSYTVSTTETRSQRVYSGSCIQPNVC